MMGMNKDRSLFLELIRRSRRDGRVGSLIFDSEAMVGGERENGDWDFRGVGTFKIDQVKKGIMVNSHLI